MTVKRERENQVLPGMIPDSLYHLKWLVLNTNTYKQHQMVQKIVFLYSYVHTFICTNIHIHVAIIKKKLLNGEGVGGTWEE